VQDDIADQVEEDEDGNRRLWAGRGVGRGPLWVEGGEKRAQVCLPLHGGLPLPPRPQSMCGESLFLTALHTHAHMCARTRAWW